MVNPTLKEPAKVVVGMACLSLWIQGQFRALLKAKKDMSPLLKKQKNVFYAIPDDEKVYSLVEFKGEEYKPEKEWRIAELIMAYLLSVVLPDHTIGITRGTKDGGADIVVYKDDVIEFMIDAKSGCCDRRISLEFINRVNKLPYDWYLMRVCCLKESDTDYLESDSCEKVKKLTLDKFANNVAAYALQGKSKERTEEILENLEKIKISKSH